MKFQTHFQQTNHFIRYRKAIHLRKGMHCYKPLFDETVMWFLKYSRVAISKETKQ